MLIYIYLRPNQYMCEEREKTNKMQQSDVYIQLLSQHVSGIIMPIFRRTKTVLLHMVYCGVTSTAHSSHQTGTTHASKHPPPIHQTWKTYEADTSPTQRHTHLHTTFAYTHEFPTRFTTHYPTKKTSRLMSAVSRLWQNNTPKAVTGPLISWRWA